jgi:DNA-directed RNA polymerase specialized sigma24 family protein
MQGVAEGKTMLELSRELGIGLEACKKRVQRAREYLKKRI